MSNCDALHECMDALRQIGSFESCVVTSIVLTFRKPEERANDVFTYGICKRANPGQN